MHNSTMTARALVVALLLGSSTTIAIGAQAVPAAQTAQAAAPAEPAEPSMTPEAFVQSVGRANLLEVALGTLAAANGQSPEVKDFGKRMATNHTAIQVIVDKLATGEHITLPTELDAESQATILMLSDLHGTPFDKAYMMLMAERQAAALAAFRWQYDNCTSDAVKPFAMQTMPIMGTHARLSEQLNAVINKEELRIAAEKRAEEHRAAEVQKAQEAAEAAATAAKRKGSWSRPRRN